MADPSRSTNAQNETTSADATAKARFAAIMHEPRRAVWISGGLVLLTLIVNFFILKDRSGPLFVVTVISALMFGLTLWQIVDFSPAKVARLEALAPHVGGRFSPWKGGAGGYAGSPFAYTIDHERFGILNFTALGMQIEIGQLSSRLSPRSPESVRRRHGYVAIRLPERLPHMFVDFGHLASVLGVRVMPRSWRGSQRVDVGDGRRFRLFVADGGEHLAQSLFSPEMVRLFQRVGRYYDIEVKGRYLYLCPSRPVVAGSDRRWQTQRALIEDVTAMVAGSMVWDLVRRQSRGSGPVYGELRPDTRRAITIVFSVAGVAVVILSLIVLKFAGLLE